MFINPSHLFMKLHTADLIDAHGDELQSCDIQFLRFGARSAFHGPVRTVQTRDDNLLIKNLLAGPGENAVLVIDGGGSLQAALMGGMVAQSAQDNHWAGVIVFGAVRDTVALASLDLGIKALGVNPRKSTKLGTGAVDVPVTFGQATFAPGSWVYSDEDGIVVSATRIH